MAATTRMSSNSMAAPTTAQTNRAAAQQMITRPATRIGIGQLYAVRAHARQCPLSTHCGHYRDEASLAAMLPFRSAFHHIPEWVWTLFKYLGAAAIGWLAAAGLDGM